MRYRKPRTFRHRSNGRSFHRRSNDGDTTRLTSGSFSNGKHKNNFKPYQSAEKLLERYKMLAKEALSSGDKILSENYLQHVDHFMRIVSHKNLNQNDNESKTVSLVKETDNNLPDNSVLEKKQAFKEEK